MVVAIATAQIGFLPYQAATIGSWPEVVAIGDVNNDGRNDIVLGTGMYFDPQNDFKIFVFTQDAQGNLNAPVKYAYATSGSGIESIDIADLNNDNLNDVVIGYANSIGIFFQNSTGTLNSIQSYASGNKVDGTICGDLNNDGLNDIAVSHWNETFIRVFYQTATGFTSSTYGKPVGGYDEIDVGDVNGDGLNDVVFMSGQITGGIHVFLQNTSGTLNSYTSYFPASTTWNFLHGIAIGDINNDGKNDVLASMGGNTPNARIVQWFQDTATGLLQSPPIEIMAYDIPEPIEVADLNCDGKNEIISAHGGWSRVSVFEQDSLGVYGAYNLYNVTYASHYNPYGLAVGDINGDQKKDIAIADYNSGLILLINNSTALPSQIDTTGFVINQDTLYTNSYQTTSTFTDTNIFLFNNYRVTEINTYSITRTFQEDSIKTDTLFFTSSQLCSHLVVDTSVASHIAYTLIEKNSQNLLLSTSRDTVNTISEINVYPNPTSDLLYVDLPSPFDSKNLRIAIYTELGQLVYYKIYTDRRNKRQIDLSDFVSGSYIISFRLGEVEVTRKVIKIR